jgi:hypothetical protein
MASKKILTLDEAYDAMVDFLEKYYKMTNSDDIGSFLSAMQLIGKAQTADPAMWHDWKDSVDKILKQPAGSRPYFKLYK